ncbi:2Fe-2S iron-sulfur cluster-binding protein [Streptomyces flavalbus]|uniref:2Fe-2S iron-sulfur cluster-binding protein n=1 Tax=Streptomyces flavalbus TaxID=2665155 RepID=A0ABW2WL79_9ACTN
MGGVCRTGAFRAEAHGPLARYCQPGQIMAAVALVRRVREEGRAITEADLDGIRNICRCGTYPRIREAIRAGAERM